jgi:hypothetical protein
MSLFEHVRSTMNAKIARFARDEESSTEREARFSQDRNRHRIQRTKKSSTLTYSYIEQNGQSNRESN